MAKSSAGNGCLTIFSLPFAGVGLFMLYLIEASLWNSYRFSKWPVTSATILSADLKTNVSSDGSTQKVVATYRYVWEGETYEGDRVRIGKTSDNVGSFHRRKAEFLQQVMRNHQTVDVHVNPSNPSESILFPEIRWEMIGFYSLFVVLFGGAGFGMLVYSIKSRHHVSAVEERKTTSPGEPWTWKPEWASGEIKSGGKTGAMVMTVFALIWNLVSLPVLFAFREEFMEKGNRVFAVALLFPLIGVFLIFGLVYVWVRYLKYGGCTFVMQKMPGVIGGRLMGAIRIPKGVYAQDGVEVTLRNVRRITTGSGKHRTTRESVLWSDARRLSDWRNGPSGETLLPVLFEIPYDTEPYEDENPNNKVLWTLQANAKTPGVDFHADFTIPVFRTPDSDPDFVPTQNPGDDWNEPDVQQRLWAEEHIRTEIGPMASTRLVFPMMRHKGYSLGMWIFTLIWNAIVVGIWISPAPRFFFFAFGFFGVIMLIGSIHSSLTRQILDLRPGHLEARGGLFGLSGPRQFNARHLETLNTHSSSSQGNTAYYTLRVKDESGKNRSLVSLIKGKNNAERLLAYIRETCGVS